MSVPVLGEKEATFNTLWFDLADVSGITSIKYDAEGKKFYVNNLSKAWDQKTMGSNFGYKVASRRYDIEFRTQYFYAEQGGEVVEVAVKVPMLFVQEEVYDTITADIAEKNSGVNASVTVSATNINKQKSDYATLVDEFIDNKAEITMEQIIAFIGDKKTFD